MTEKRQHKVSVIVEGQQIDGWMEYEVHSSMIEPADSFTLRRAFDQRAWNTLRRDARVRVLIDGTTILDGIIDDRRKRSKEYTLEITGRDRAGRLVQESADVIGYDGLEITEAIRRLASPWFGKVSLSNARNRRLMTGKGRKVSSGTEPVEIQRRRARGGQVHPGQSRWSAIQEIAAQAQLLVWSSADGREIILGQPNYDQAAQFLVRLARAGGPVQSTCTELDYSESNGDRYSWIAVVGTGGDTDTDYGINISSRRAFVTDNEDNKIDGTGRDFLYPKRLLMPEKDFDSNQDAAEVARREQVRRDFRRITVAATMPQHGQFIGAGAPTIFAPDTIARVIDEDFDPAKDFEALIYACTYRGSRDGETTALDMVPAGTEIIL